MERDQLTGVLRWPEFMRQVGDRRAGAVLFVDIDQLRFSNAVCGWAKTDVLLRSMALVVSAVCDGELVARCGGAQFIVYVRDADGAERLAEAVRVAFVRGFEAERAYIRAGTSAAGVIDPMGPILTVSIGTAHVARHSGLQEALEVADRRAGEAVMAGRDRVVS
jgi:diguanylate cyclase (GGDEF)-like protein